MTDVTQTETYQANQAAWQHTLTQIALLGQFIYGNKGTTS